MIRVGKKMLIMFGVFSVISSAVPLRAESSVDNNTADPEVHENFDPGTFIFDHISDSHEWPIMEIRHKNISVPLPVILYSKSQGFVLFSSSRFDHGRSSYRNFHVALKGDNKGKVVEDMPDGSQVLPIDLSITKNVASIFISIIILLLIFVSVGNAYKKRGNRAPKGLQSWIEPVILFIRDDIARPSIGEKKYEKFMPFLLTIFFFIWINNMLGIVPFFPGGADVTGNIAVTGVLAAFTFIITTINGNKHYWKHIVNMEGVPIWLKVPPLPIIPLVEILSIFTKPFVLMVRLFANITAGHIIALGFISLIFLFGSMHQVAGWGFSFVSISFLIFMTLIELLVAFIQAYVFTFLSALYFGMATEDNH